MEPRYFGLLPVVERDPRAQFPRAAGDNPAFDAVALAAGMGEGAFDGNVAVARRNPAADDRKICVGTAAVGAQAEALQFFIWRLAGGKPRTVVEIAHRHEHFRA